MEILNHYLPLLIPLLLLQLVLMAVALLDLRRREKTRGPKWLWVVIIIFGEMVGPIVYFAVGRLDE
jgi:DMSO reductase anchor subunit